MNENKVACPICYCDMHEVYYGESDKAFHRCMPCDIVTETAVHLEIQTS